jgi:hypothetical protein
VHHKVLYPVIVLAFSFPLETLATEQLNWRGFAELNYDRFPPFTGNNNGNEYTNPRQVHESGTGKLQLETGYSPANSGLSFNSRVYIRYDTENSDKNDERFDELWLHYSLPEWDIRIGNQLVTWGSVESVSPLDVINPRDYEEDIVEPIKIGTPALRGRRRFSSSEFTFYWLPYYQPSVYVGPQSYYAIGGGLPNDYPESEWHNNQYAARYFFNGDGYDIGISYLDAYERNAGFDLDEPAQRMIGTTYQSKRLGFEATYTLDELILKSEIVYRTSNELDNENTWLYALGAEYTASSLIAHSDLTIFAEYLAASSNAHDLELMQDDIFVAARWAFNDLYQQRLQLGYFIDLDNTSAYALRAEYKISPIESWDVGLRYTATRHYYPSPEHTEGDTSVYRLFLRMSF